MTRSNSESEGERARDALPDKTQMETFRTAHEERRELTAQLRQQEQELAAEQAAGERANRATASSRTEP